MYVPAARTSGYKKMVFTRPCSSTVARGNIFVGNWGEERAIVKVVFLVHCYSLCLILQFRASSRSVAFRNSDLRAYFAVDFTCVRRVKYLKGEFTACSKKKKVSRATHHSEKSHEKSENSGMFYRI